MMQFYIRRGISVPSAGFDNIANVLKVSPAFLDQYITAARFVATQAIGEKSPKALTTSLRVPAGVDQSVHIEGLPLGTRGGMLAEHLFPADGEYRFTISGLAVGGYVGGLEYEHTLIITIDGQKVFSGKVGGEEDRPLSLSSGNGRLSAQQPHQ